MEAMGMRRRLCREDSGFTIIELAAAMAAVSGVAWAVQALT
jgi:prepilin-type N-terminal cleavage/methylation domain-containing protein